MNPPVVTYEVVERKGNLDCAEFSICPNCSLHIIKLASGCDVCGWSDGDKLLGEKSISPSKKFDTFKNEEDKAIALIGERKKVGEIA